MVLSKHTIQDTTYQMLDTHLNLYGENGNSSSGETSLVEKNMVYIHALKASLRANRYTDRSVIIFHL